MPPDTAMPRAKIVAVSGAAAIVCAGALLVAATPAPVANVAVDGGALFKQRCQGCHSVTAGAAAVVAPNLAGVVGRKAAATPYRYSDALKASGLTWSRANLDKYLSGPMQLVPGTRMVVKVANPNERQAIIDYLAKSGR